MARILLKPGETIEISPADSDGVITITYGSDALTVHADMPDSTGREGLIYEEILGPSIEKMMDEADAEVARDLDRRHDGASWDSLGPAVSAPDRWVADVVLALDAYAKSDTHDITQAIEDARAQKLGDDLNDFAP